MLQGSRMPEVLVSLYRLHYAAFLVSVCMQTSRGMESFLRVIN